MTKHENITELEVGYDIPAVPVPSGTDPSEFTDAVTTTCTPLAGGAVLAEETTVYADGRPPTTRDTVVVPEPGQREVIIRIGPDSLGDAGAKAAADDLLARVVVLDPSAVTRDDVLAGYVAVQH